MNGWWPIFCSSKLYEFCLKSQSSTTCFLREFKNMELEWGQGCSVTSFKMKILYCTNFWDNSNTFSCLWNKEITEHLLFKCQTKSFWNPTFLFHSLTKSYTEMEKVSQLIQRSFNPRHHYRLWRVTQCPWCILHRESRVAQHIMWKVWGCFNNFLMELKQINVINKLREAFPMFINTSGITSIS